MPALPSGGSGPSRHAKQAPGSGAGTQQGPRQAYLHCHLVVDMVHSNMYVSVVGCGRCADKHACITMWQSWDMAGTQTGMLVTPGGRTRGENRSTCIAIWWYRVQQACKKVCPCYHVAVLRHVRHANRCAKLHMVALGQGEGVNRHARLPSGRAGT